MAVKCININKKSMTKLMTNTVLYIVSDWVDVKLC